MAARPPPLLERRCPAAALLVCVCVLALIHGTSAQCTAGYMRLDLVHSTNLADSMGRCLTSVNVTLYSNCGVSLTPLNVAGNFVPSIWTGNAAKTYTQFTECPLEEGTRVAPVGSGAASVKAAIQRAFEGHVYGFDASSAPLNPMTLTSMTFAAGLVTLTHVTGEVLSYAVTQRTLNASQVDPGNALAAITSCSQLPTPALTCVDNSIPNGIANACPVGRTGIEINIDLKVCALCPAGSFSDAGHGCTSCMAGSISTMGSPNCPTNCGAGTFAPGGGSTCLPCPPGTYSDGPMNGICSECPADSYAWTPGSSVCLRCVQGIPRECTGGDCGPDPLSPGSHIVTVGQMATCGLTGNFSVRAWSKCTSWSQASPTIRVQFAMEVAGDCSINIKPMADPSCADPTSSVGLLYGAIQMRAYYADATKIRSLLPTDASGGPMLSIEPTGGASSLAWTFWAASGNPADYDEPPITGATTCTATASSVVAGQLLGKPSSPVANCPARSYSVPDAYCYACPPGSFCPGATGTNSGPKPVCPAGTYNPNLGGTCISCPAGLTSYAGATQCNVPVIDKDCYLANYGGIGMEYDAVSQTCVLCPAGTVRNDTLKQCVDCPAGQYSGPGAAVCTPCPAGQYNPSPGLADQEPLNGIFGQHCFSCPSGSLALSGNQTAPTVLNGQIVEGATFCDPCPSGFVQNITDPLHPCVPCANTDPVLGRYTYRTGDATPENNQCVLLPSGYRMKDPATGVVPNTEVELCPNGTISYWSPDGLVRTPTNEFRCIGCADLAPAEDYVHMYAPHEGMIACIACPSGTVPVTTGSPGSTSTAECTSCPNGYYRDEYTKSKTCLKCGEGKEVGRSANQECTACRPGHIMTVAMATANATYCEPCPRNFYQPSMAATSCLACGRGYGTQDTGNIECYPCPVGYYSLGGGDCRPAPAGTFINTTAAFFFTACPEGTWNDEAGSDNCLSCGPGKYSNTVGSTECKTCGAGTYSSTQAVKCIDCRAGYSAPAGSDRCHPCKPGFYSEQRKAAQCKPCQKGFQCPTAAMSRPGACPRGTFSNKEGNKLCTPCPINTISLGGLNSTNPQPTFSCIRCPVGTSTRGLTGQSRCHVLRPQVRRLLLETEEET